MLNEKDKALLKCLQGDMPLVLEPYKKLAEEIGASEEEVLARLSQWMNKGVLRRVGAVLRHQQAGFTANAMIGWRVEEQESDRVGAVLAAHPAVTHCYLRKTPDDWPYNLFCMVHATDQEELEQAIKDLIRLTGIEDLKILRSVVELKKTSVKFIQHP